MKLRWPFTRKSLANPEGWLLELFGSAHTASGTPVSVEAALRVPAVTSAVRVVSDAAASLSVMVVAVDDMGKETADPKNPILPLLRDAANDWTSGFEFIRDLTIDALVSDAGGLAYVNRVGEGKVQEIIKYPRGVIQVEYDQSTGEPKYRINNAVVPSQNIIHLRSPFGYAPLTLAREAIGISIVMERHAARLFGRGARPSGALKFPKGMGEESAKKARSAWRATHEGDDTGGQTAILWDGAEFVPFTFNSVDSQFLQLRQHQNLEVARAFRVPPSMVFELGRATWSNTEQMGREFLIYCLEPWLLALEGALRRALFMPEDRAAFAVRFDRDDLTRADLTTRATAINSLRASKIINANEGRDWLGLPSIGPEGDTFENPNTGSTKTEAEGPKPEDEAQPLGGGADDETDTGDDK